MGALFEGLGIPVVSSIYSLYTGTKSPHFHMDNVQIKNINMYCIISSIFYFLLFFVNFVFAHFFLFTFLIENKLKLYLLAIDTVVYHLIHHLMKHIFIWPLNLLFISSRTAGKKN